MPFKIFLSLLVFVTVLQSAGAQSYFFRKYQVENGLSNNATISCLQDHKGFMWFGTKDGLNRFDGYTYKIFRNDPDVPEALATTLFTAFMKTRQVHCGWAQRADCTNMMQPLKVLRC